MTRTATRWSGFFVVQIMNEFKQMLVGREIVSIMQQVLYEANYAQHWFNDQTRKIDMAKGKKQGGAKPKC